MSDFGSYAITAGRTTGAIGSAPVQWAMNKLAAALDARGSTPIAAADASLGVSLHEPGDPEAAGARVPDAAEAFAILRDGSRITVVARDPRGFVYALTELADRAEHAEAGSLDGPFPLVEQPATPVRAVSRLFVSEVEDKPWLHDTTQWLAYLDMLVANRFNRFSLALGMGYDYPYHNNLVSDVYLHFPYPFLLDVPGHAVRVKELPDSERDANMAALRFIGREAARRGLDFQLQLWTQRYDFDDSPDANYTVDGVDEANIAGYCRDAVALLLREVPEITGLTFRIHVEGGISEGDYGFWRTVFGAIKDAGRPVLIDMHAKGLDETTLDLGLETGMPTAVSPKYLAEHMGLPYQTSAIREREYPPAEAMTNREKLSVGSRRFMRQSYGDMLPADKRWQVIFRVWPGTQRVLAWGDPAFAAAYGRSATFAGADGIEYMEPLSFKGRQGSGIRGGRTVTRAPDLATRYEWEKYGLQYRLFGRLSFAPEADAEGWRRYLRTRCGNAAEPVEAALSAASRVLPLVTHAHGPSIANNNYWPEVYTNIAVLGDNRHRPYGDDMTAPLRFGNASSFDPQFIANAREYVLDLLAGRPTRRYTPLDVADWLERWAEEAEVALARARSRPDAARPATRALVADAGIAAALGRFFAAKFRAACWAELLLETHARDAHLQVVALLRQGRDAWRTAARIGADVYPEDITFGRPPHLRGSWERRDGDVERELRDAQAFRFREGEAPPSTGEAAARALRGLQTRRPVRAGQAAAVVPAEFRPGDAVSVQLPVAAGDASEHVLHFRRINQAERWQSVPMPVANGAASADIPADYVRSRFHLQYAITSVGPDGCTITPGFPDTLGGPPYGVIRQAVPG